MSLDKLVQVLPLHNTILFLPIPFLSFPPFGDRCPSPRWVLIGSIRGRPPMERRCESQSKRSRRFGLGQRSRARGEHGRSNQRHLVFFVFVFVRRRRFWRRSDPGGACWTGSKGDAGGGTKRPSWLTEGMTDLDVLGMDVTTMETTCFERIRTGNREGCETNRTGGTKWKALLNPVKKKCLQPPLQLEKWTRTMQTTCKPSKDKTKRCNTSMIFLDMDQSKQEAVL